MYLHSIVCTAKIYKIFNTLQHKVLNFLKYLKALFDRLQSEKENAGKANLSENYDSGVSLSLGGGMDMPVMTTQEVQQPDIGGSMDIEV